jgi:hypothetical protein
MGRNMEGNKKIELTMRLSEFEMPPMQDVLIVGKMAPIGSEAARRMVEILSPDQYEVKKLDHPSIEAIVIRKALLKMMPEDKLIAIILEEGEKVANETMIVRVQLNITVLVSKSIEL